MFHGMIRIDNIIHKDCEICGGMFRTTNKTHKYCSLECRKEANKNHQSQYMIKREDIFQRDSYKCVYCGKSSIEDGVKLHLDHVYPIDKGGDCDLKNMVTACEECNLHKTNNILSYEIIERIWVRNEKLNERYSDTSYDEMVRVFEDNKKKRTGS